MADLPSWDDLPTQAPPAWDDLPAGAPPAWDDLPTSDEEAPSALGSGLREAAHSVGAGIGAGLGMAGGAALGALGGPAAFVTAPAGAIAGGVAGGMAGQKAEDWLLEKLGMKQGTGQMSDVQRQQDIQTNPKSSFAGQLVGSIAPSFGVGAAPALATRAVGAGIQGGLEAGQEAYQGEDLSPSKIAIAGAAGAAFPSARNWVSKVEAGAGARLGLGNAKAATPPAGEAAPPNPDVKTTPAEEAISTSETGDPRKDMELQVAREQLAGADEGMKPLWQSHIDNILNPPADASQGPNSTQNAFTPKDADLANDITTTAKGVAAENPPAPNVPGAGNPVGAPMQAREASRPSDPLRDYRKDQDEESMYGGSAWGATDQTSMPLSTADIREDVAAALQSGPPPQPPGQAPAMKQPEQPAATPPAAPVQTGIPFMVTNAMKQQLAQQGHSPDAIRNMTPAQAHEALAQPPAAAAPPNGNIIQQGTQIAARRPIVEAPMPSAANSTKDLRGPVYVHPGTPPQMARLVAVHETVEGILEAQGMPYPQAHEIATQAEKAAVERAGIDWDEYQSKWGDIAKEAAKLPRDTPLPPGLASDPWADIGHYGVKGPDEGVAQAKGPEAQDATAAVTAPASPDLDAARARMDSMIKAGKLPEEARTKFEALPPEQQAPIASELLSRTENLRAPRKSETGITVKDKATKARIEGAVAAVKKAVGAAPEIDATLDPSVPADRVQIQQHAKDMWQAAVSAFDGKDPIKKPTGYMPNLLANRLPEHNILKAARSLALSEKPSKETFDNYLSALQLKGETGRNVDTEIGFKPSRDVANHEGGEAAQTAEQDRVSERPFHDPYEGTITPAFEKTSGYDQAEYTTAQNDLREWLNNLPDAAHAALMKANPDLLTDLETTRDPVELKQNYVQDLAKAQGSTPGIMEHPAENGPVVKKTRITNAAQLNEPDVTPTKEGKVLDRNSPEFKAAAAAALNTKVGQAPILEKGSAAWKSASTLIRDFAANEGGGGPPLSMPKLKMPRFMSDWLAPKAQDPTNAARTPDISDQLNKVSGFIREYANKRGADKLKLQGNSVAAEAHGLSPDEWKQVELAVTNKQENALPGKLRDAYKDTVAPLLAKDAATYQRILDKNDALGLGMKLEAIHPGFDNLNFPRIESSEDLTDNEDSNVITGNKFSNMADSLKPRRYMGLLDQASGQRVVLLRGDDGKFSVLQNGNVHPVKTPPTGFDGNVGDTIPLYRGGKKVTFTVDHADTAEIEKASDTGNGPTVNYIHNPVVTLSNRLNQLQNVEANIDLIQKIKDDPWWAENTTTDPAVAKKNGWDRITSNLDALGKRNGRDVFMPRNMRWLIDDMHAQGFSRESNDLVAQASSIMARTFLATGGAIHVGNMATNAVIARGFDNITPKGVQNLGTYGARAIKAMMDPANSKDYYDALEAGLRPQFHNTITHDLIPNMMKRFGVDIAKEPSKWDPIAKIWGISTPDLARAAEHFSTKEMWRMGDMFSLQRFLELRDGQGMSPEDAAAEVNKFSSYDTGPTFGAQNQVGRRIQQLMTDPRTSLFGRWHMLLMRSMAHVTRNALGFAPGRTLTDAQRIQGVGQLLAAGGLAYVAFPAADAGLKAISGNPDAEVGRRGMLATTDAIQKLLAGDTDYAKAMSTIATPSIPVTMLGQGLRNQSWTGKQIVPPMPMTPSNAARGAAEVGDWAAGNAVAPYGNIAGSLSKGTSAAGAAGKFVAGMVGGKLPSPQAQKFQQNIPKATQAAIKARQKAPGGLFEAGVNAMTR